MSDRTRAAVAAAAIVLLAAILPTLALARPANEIPVAVESGADDALATPTGDAWTDVPAVDVPLTAAPSGLPDASDTSVGRASIQVARTERTLYLRLSWPDATAEESVDGPRSFADAAAVQLPVNTTTRPPIAMGSERNTVNVWYWSADGRTEELVAGGPGTTTEFREPAVTTETAHRDGRWSVVFRRDLTVNAENRTQLTLDRDVDVAVAVWNGTNMERSGRKAVSEWHYLALGPGPQGPPYETLLWTAAGIAIVVVVAVTVLAARRS